jgi:hypothetical protein
MEFQEGDYVLLRSSNITLPWQRKQQSRKLQPRFLGPFQIFKKQSPLVYQLKLPPSLKLHPVFHISRLERYTGDVESLGSQPPPELVLSGDTAQEEWEVETIMDQRQRKRGRTYQTEYLVKWKDYPLHDATWEPEDNLQNAQEAIAEFKLRTT